MKIHKHITQYNKSTYRMPSQAFCWGSVQMGLHSPKDAVRCREALGLGLNAARERET